MNRPLMPISFLAFLLSFVVSTASISLAAPIHAAAAKGDLAKVTALLKANAALLNSKDSAGATPLHFAVAKDRQDVIKLLLAKKADVNVGKKDGVTPLHVAAALGYTETAALLLQAGADPNAADKQGRTALLLAQRGQKDSLAQLLLEHTSDNLFKQGSSYCAALYEKVDASQWFTSPNSRLVVSPTKDVREPLPQGLAPSLPMNLAYYYGETPVSIATCWAWQPGNPDAIRSAVIPGPASDFSPQRSGAWQAGNVTADFEGKQVRLTVAKGTNFGALIGKVTVDLTETPYLLVQVVQRSGAAWAVKVMGEGDTADKTLIGDTFESGGFTADVQSATGWRGKRTFEVRLFVVGPPGSSVTFSGFRFIGIRGAVPSASMHTATWYPHQMVTPAESGASGLQFECTTCFPDAHNVSQRLRVTQAGSQSLTLVGHFPASAIRLDAVRNTLMLEALDFRVAIAVSHPGRWLGIFPSWGDWLVGASDASALSGVWGIQFDQLRNGQEIVVSASFEPSNSGPGIAESAQRYASPDAFTKAVRERERYWNSLLASVPQPSSFQLHVVDPRGAKTDAITRMYYKAWVFLLTNTLPPMIENQFPFTQALCGKASMWRDGAPKTRSSAQWESFIAMQFLALVDPDNAWSAFEGMMSLVRRDGVLEGEGLPSRHSQTAWILYSLTGDREHLRRVYPAVKRLLLWKASHPLPTGANVTPYPDKYPNLIEHESFIHALMDMVYARDITTTLGMTGDVTEWQKKIDDFATKYPNWFWDAGGTFCELSDGKGGHDLPRRFLGVQGLVLPPSLLKERERESLLRLYDDLQSKDVPFLIAGLGRQPNYSYTMLGLWQYGRVNESAMMAEAAIRDVTLAQDFGEGYSESYPVQPSGVRPDAFGAALMIDSVLWHNGVILGCGLPIIAHVPNAVGVDNIFVLGAPINVRWDKSGNGLTLTGNGLKRLKLPLGFKMTTIGDGTPKWRGEVSVGKQVALQAAAPN